MEYEAYRGYRNDEREPTRTTKLLFFTQVDSRRPADARELLLRHSDLNDAEIQFMLECLEILRGGID
jgi:hypothetical protein